MNKRTGLYAFFGMIAVVACGVAYTLAQPAQSEESITKTQVTNTTTNPQPAASDSTDDVDMSKVSEAFGHFIGRNLKSPGVKFDLEAIIKGMREGAAGKPAPMTDQEYEMAMLKLQEKAIKQVSEENLKEADEFLQKNAKNSNIVIVDPGKLQYLILEEGKGTLVKDHDQPQINYTGKYADGTVFGSSEDAGGPITIPLDQTIPGFSKGIVGMKEGEKRRLFVHPDLGYGTKGNLPPNKLLIFDVEVIKANNAQEKKAASLLENEDELENSLGDDEDADPTAEYSEISDEPNSKTPSDEGEDNPSKFPGNSPSTK